MFCYDFDNWGSDVLEILKKTIRKWEECDGIISMFFGRFLRIMISSVLRFSMWFNINLVISKILLSSTLRNIVKSTSWDYEFTILLQRSLIGDKFNFLTNKWRVSYNDVFRKISSQSSLTLSERSSTSSIRAFKW
jgi:hypothetical protein